jgi:hypothetical protein
MCKELDYYINLDRPKFVVTELSTQFKPLQLIYIDFADNLERKDESLVDKFNVIIRLFLGHL